MSLSRALLAFALALPIGTAGAQWQVGASTGRYFTGGPRPFLQTSLDRQTFRRTDVGIDGADIHAFAFKAVSGRLDLGVELGYSNLAFSEMAFTQPTTSFSISGARGTGSQYLGLAKLRFKISDDAWRLRIQTTAGVGIINQQGFRSVDPDAANSMTRPLGELGVALAYPLSQKFGLRVEQSWLFYETASDRSGLTTSTKGLRDHRFSVGFEFTP